MQDKRGASPTRWSIPILLAVIALGGSIASTARAEKADRDKPINYSADGGDIAFEAKTGTLIGNAIVIQGTMIIRADKIVFKQNLDNSLSATAFGNPVSFRQKRDGVNEYYEGFAQRAVWDGTKQLLQLYDRALLKNGQDEIRSNYISYDANTEFFKAEGRPASAPGLDEGPLSGRVRGIFQPKAKEGEGPAPPAASNPLPSKAKEPLPLKPSQTLPATKQ